MIKDAHSDSELAYMPSRAFGTQPIKVRSKKFSHNLSINTPTEVQANTDMTVELDLGGTVEKDTVAMVAVVDEGLLSLTNFKTPDPSDALFPKMPLDVNTAETVGWGISPSMDSAPAGGGADGGDARRKAKVVKPVPYGLDWSMSPQMEKHPPHLPFRNTVDLFELWLGRHHRHDLHQEMKMYWSEIR